MKFFNWTLNGMKESRKGCFVTVFEYQKLEAKNARLRQQRDAANAMLDFFIENKKAP